MSYRYQMGGGGGGGGGGGEHASNDPVNTHDCGK